MKSISLFKFNLVLLLLIILLGWASSSKAQNAWQYVGDYNDVIGLYDSQHFVVDIGNGFYKYTTDGGITLKDFGMNPSSTQLMVQIQYLSAMHLRVTLYTGNTFEIHESTDGGATFSLIGSILPTNMFAVGSSSQTIWFDQQEGLFSCKVLYNTNSTHALFRSTDGGVTWNLATTDTFALHDLHGIKMYKDGRVIMANNLPTGLEISTDRGVTFTRTSSFPPMNNFMTLAYDGGQNMWISGIIGSNNADSYISTDGGATWNPWTAVPEDVFIEHIKPNTLMVAGSRLNDTTAISTDGGTTFSKVGFPSVKPSDANLQLRLGSDLSTYYLYDNSYQLFIYNTGGGVNLAERKTTSANIYPNPASDQISIENYSGMVEVLNSSGQLLKSFEIDTAGSLDISDLPSGLLVLKLHDGLNKFIKY